jgi:hypothetical protein
LPDAQKVADIALISPGEPFEVVFLFFNTRCLLATPYFGDR